ncbi:FAD-binding domain-containing protein [Pilatotrama ljubarskyi]|nr:FAD-binding domain-containing protein [Pilatotrama ljubarskyi]
MFLTRLLLPLSTLCALSQISGAVASRCRCLYGDPCWPSQGDFESLQRELSQPLVHPSPPAKPCYIDANSPECAAVVQGWGDGNWRADQPGAMQATNFETFIFANGTIDACYLNTSLGQPCDQGSVSVVGVDARTVEDIQAGVKFAAKHDLRLAVKNTGHDYLGRSDARGSFVIWTHHLKNITVSPSFRPTGAPSNEAYEGAMTFGAGVQWHEAYAAANASGRVLVGGVSEGGSVGAAGGWLQGGGHSALSPSYGLGVDNVLEFSLVTSTGACITANAHQHSDLFWALRGGGGGTFGVVTSLTYRTRPATPIIAATLSATVNGTTPNAPLRQAFAELVRITPTLEDGSWGGYVFTSTSNGTFDFTFIAIVPNVTWAQANATMNPYLDYVQGLAANASAEDPLIISKASTEPFPSFYDWYLASIPTEGQVGGNIEIGSWLLPRTVVEGDHEKVSDTLMGIGTFNYYLVAGGAVSRVDPSTTGLNPVWRSAAAHALVGTIWPEGTNASTIDQLRQGLKDNTAKLRALAPQSGAYINEASLYEPNPTQAFFGSHYQKLKAIKKVYDPLDLFVVAEGVGSDDWDKALNCHI